ncbi:2Fe-2S iron-sulfur cluster-binding protein [Streptomyces sp. NPDC006372]|uniref:2Fe-2S iron-sulfur cluster-binding protein n=1 Tax=Streptomyces sp. NPDC006372 TaxID=3155599 RepID=UPI0033BE1667
MTDDQHGEGTPRGGSRWDPLPQGEYDDGATAFVELPEGGVDALLAAHSPLAAPGHGYVPPQIAADPAATAGTDPAATGWPVPGAPVDGAQWHDPHTAHQQGHEHGGHQQQYGAGEQSYDAPYGSGARYGSGAGAGQHGGNDRFTYDPGATGQWNVEEAASAETAPGHDVTGQWSIPVAGGDLPDESGEFTTSSLVEQWGGTPPPTLPGGAPAPWATQAAGRPWGQDPAAQEQPGPGHPHEHGHEHGYEHGGPEGAGPTSGYAPEQPHAAPLPQETDPAAGHAPEEHGSTGHAPGGGHLPQPYENADAGHAPETPGYAGHGPEMPGAEHTHQPSDGAGHAPEHRAAGHATEPTTTGHAPERSGFPGHDAEPTHFTGHGPEQSAFADGGPEQSAFADGGREQPAFTDGGPEQPAFTDGGREQPAYPDHGPGHGPESSGFPGHAPEPTGVRGHGPEPTGAPGHAPEPSGPAGDPAEHPARSTSSPQPYAEAPGDPAPEAHAEPAVPSEPAQEASRGVHGPGEASEGATEVPEASEAPAGADGPGEPSAGPLPAEAVTDAGSEAVEAEPSNDPAPDAPSPDDPAAHPHEVSHEASHDTPPAMPQEEHPLASFVLRVNGAERPVTDAWIGESLLYVLRERLGLAGAKDGCSQGECGACNVQVDGRLVASCLVPAVTAAGSEVRTVEGLAEDGQPSDVQRALARCGAVQCGFCVPGMAMTVHDLLEGNPAPTELETRQALCGNLCRCSGYRGVVDAVKEVVAERETHAAPADGTTDEPRIPNQAGPGAGGVNPSAFGLPPGAHAPDAHSPDLDDQPYGQDGGPA